MARKKVRERYSTHNEGKSVLAERFIRTLNDRIYKYMTSITKNVYIDKLDDIVNKYNNTYHSTIKMKPVDVKSSTYIDSSKDINDKDSKFKIGNIVRISKYKIIFANVSTPNWSEKVFVIKKFKYCSMDMLLLILMKKKLFKLFTKTNCKKQIKKNLELKKWLGENVINYMLNGKDAIICLIAGLVKKI